MSLKERKYTTPEARFKKNLCRDGDDVPQGI